MKLIPNKVQPRHAVLLCLLLVSALAVTTQAFWQESLFNLVSKQNHLEQNFSKEAQVSNEATNTPETNSFKDYFASERAYVYFCGWTAQIGTLYPDGTVYEVGMLDYNPNEETRANAGYGSWSIEGNSLKGFFGPIGKAEVSLLKFPFEGGYVLSDTQQPHEDCTYLFADSKETLKRYISSLEGFGWDGMEYVFEMKPNKNSKPAPMEQAKEESVIEKVCAQHTGPGYVAEEYQSQTGVVGGYVVYNRELTGGSTYYYGSDGLLVGKIDPLPTSDSSPERERTRAFAKQLQTDFPKKTEHSCGQ